MSRMSVLHPNDHPVHPPTISKKKKCHSLPSTSHHGTRELFPGPFICPPSVTGIAKTGRNMESSACQITIWDSIKRTQLLQPKTSCLLRSPVGDGLWPTVVEEFCIGCSEEHINAKHRAMRFATTTPDRCLTLASESNVRWNSTICLQILNIMRTQVTNHITTRQPEFVEMLCLYKTLPIAEKCNVQQVTTISITSMIKGY
jgi:hypothetical protein